MTIAEKTLKKELYMSREMGKVEQKPLIDPEARLWGGGLSPTPLGKPQKEDVSHYIEQVSHVILWAFMGLQHLQRNIVQPGCLFVDQSPYSPPSPP